MSPVLPREERDAIRAKAKAYLGLSLDETLTLLDALDAAEEENGRLREALHESEQAANALRAKVDRQAWSLRRAAEHRRQGDAARAEVAALRGRIEGLHRPDEHGPGRCDKADCITSCRECGDDWPCATIRALAADEGNSKPPPSTAKTWRNEAADEGERTGR